MGYDRGLFLNPVHTELICSICYGVFENPVYLPLCRHVFCWDCISGWLNSAAPANQKTCPIDKTSIKISPDEVKKKKVSYALTNIIADQIMICKYRNLGCQETFSLSAFAVHLKACKFKPHNENADGTFASLSATSGPSASDSADATQPAAAAAAASNGPAPSTSGDSAKTSDAPKATTSTAASSSKASPSKAKANKQKKNLCKLSHPKNIDSDKVYFAPDWKYPEDKKLVKLTFKSIRLSYKPYKLASYMKNLAQVDVYCVHTDMEYSQDLTKDLSVRVLEEQYEKVLRSDLWPSKVSITAHLGLKQITIKGSLKLLRGEDFYGFDEKNEERKQRNANKRKKRAEAKKQKEEQLQLKKKAQAKQSNKPNDKESAQASSSNGPQPNDKSTKKIGKTKKNDKPSKHNKKQKKGPSNEASSSSAMDVATSSKSSDA